MNPKTALFFLAFIPQLVEPSGIVFVQLLLLGTISVVLNTLVDYPSLWDVFGLDSWKVVGITQRLFNVSHTFLWFPRSEEYQGAYST